MVRNIMILMLVVFVVACSQAQTTENQTPPETQDSETVNSVTVNGELISAEEISAVEQSLAQQGQQIPREQIVEELINQRLLIQAASDIVVTTQEAEQNIEAQLAQQNATLDDYKTQLESQGISYDVQLENIKQDMAIQQYLAQSLSNVNLEVTDAQVQEFYTLYQQQNPDAPPVEELEEQIIIALEQQKQQDAVAALLQELRAQAEIVYN